LEYLLLNDRGEHDAISKKDARRRSLLEGIQSLKEAFLV